jgi:hypothetical protein
MYGCILPSVQFLPETNDTNVNSDTASIDDTGVLVDIVDTGTPLDTGDTDTQETDTQDTDTQDTDTNTQDTTAPSLSQNGLVFMRDDYLLMTGDVLLSLEAAAGNGLNGALSNFLRPDAQWGFGVSIGEFDDVSNDSLFTQGISLFSGNGFHAELIWMQEGGLLKPILNLHKYQVEPPNEVCATYVYSNGGEVEGFEPGVLTNGFHLTVLHSQAGGSSIQVYMHTQNNGNTEFDQVISSSNTPELTDCNHDFVASDAIKFGKDRNENLNGTGSVFLPSLRARVDDVMLFDESGLSGLWANPVFVDTVYTSEDASVTLVAGAGDDGWYWFPVSTPQRGLNLNDLSVLRDETVENAHDYTLDLQNLDFTDVSPFGASNYFYNGNNLSTQ